MKFLFDDTDNVKKLESFCNEWKGTPFAHYKGQAGFGCDCIHFIVKGLECFGFDINIPWYSPDFHLRDKKELLLNGLRANVPGIELGPDSLKKDGDLVLYKFGHVMSHVGWFLHDRIWQSMTGVRLGSRTWKDKYWYDRRALVYRILNNG